MRNLFLFVLCWGLVGCNILPKTGVDKPRPPAPGGYYLDDGPGDRPPTDLDAIPNAQPKVEPLHKFANKPYSVLGLSFKPLAENVPYKMRGTASWYGKKFHGLKTASGEIYDMYAMTAAHPVLPIPSYAKVTHLNNGNSVIVRINDRGPFLNNRIIDLSYTAAYKLRLLQAGSGPVEVEKIEFASLDEASNWSAPLPGTYLQLGAFSTETTAVNLADNIKQTFSAIAHLVQLKSQDGWYRVRIGPFVERREAEAMALQVAQILQISPLLVRE